MEPSVGSATVRRRSGPTPMLDLPVTPCSLQRLLAPGYGLELVFDCTIPGSPVAKARARQGKNSSGGSVWYTPSSTSRQEASIRSYIEGWMLATRKKMIVSGPLIAEVHSYMPRPKGNKTLMHTQRPDADNLFKIVDALNEVAWGDDCQLVTTLSQKGWGLVPCIRIVLYKVTHESFDLLPR